MKSTPVPAAWIDTATATAGTATTTSRAGVTGQSHYVTHVSFTAGGTGTQQAGGYLARLVSGTATVIAQWHVSLTAPVVVNFPAPIKIASATAVFVDIAGTGANVIVNANVSGYTL